MQLPYAVSPPPDPATYKPPTTLYARAKALTYSAPFFSGSGNSSTQTQAVAILGPAAQGLLVTRVVCKGLGVGDGLELYVGDAPTSSNPGCLGSPDRLVDTSNRSTDVADYDPPLYVPPGASLVVLWPGSAAGFTGAGARLEALS